MHRSEMLAFSCGMLAGLAFGLVFASSLVDIQWLRAVLFWLGVGLATGALWLGWKWRPWDYLTVSPAAPGESIVDLPKSASQQLQRKEAPLRRPENDDDQDEPRGWGQSGVRSVIAESTVQPLVDVPIPTAPSVADRLVEAWGACLWEAGQVTSQSLSARLREIGLEARVGLEEEGWAGTLRIEPAHAGDAVFLVPESGSTVHALAPWFEAPSGAARLARPRELIAPAILERTSGGWILVRKGRVE